MSDRSIPIGALADVLNAIERAPRSHRGGRWTKAIREWRRQLLAAGATEEQAEAALGRAFAIAWRICPELREITPRPQSLENGPRKVMGRFNLPPQTKRKKRTPRPALGTGGAT